MRRRVDPEGIPADTRRWTDVCLMLAYRLRRWANIKQILVQRLVPAGGGGGIMGLEAEGIYTFI